MTKIHYLPRFILKRFRGDPSLWELDKHNVRCDPRAIDLAGQREDFWPDHIERGLMESLDNDVADILQEKVYGQEEVHLSPEHRRKIADWLGLWLIRVPSHVERLGAVHKEMREAPQSYIDYIHNEGATSIYRFMRDRRNRAFVLRAFQTEKTLARVWLYTLSFWEMLVRAGEPRGIPCLQDAFVRQLVPSTYVGYADCMEKMKWNWLRSEGTDFVIGDDPVCRNGVQSGFACGLLRPDVSVRVPLSRHLCFQMTHWADETIHVIDVNREAVLNLNRLQIMNAFQYVYGPSETSLWPDDEMVQYGLSPAVRPIRRVARRRD